jgi:hypothetical protein
LDKAGQDPVSFQSSARLKKPDMRECRMPVEDWKSRTGLACNLTDPAEKHGHAMLLGGCL